jgi:hypothetical protein
MAPIPSAINDPLPSVLFRPLSDSEASANKPANGFLTNKLIIVLVKFYNLSWKNSNKLFTYNNFLQMAINKIF